MTEEQVHAQTILIVDDTPGNVSLLKAVLTADFTIRTATCGSEALLSVQETPPDLILLDIMMPDMDGYEVCRRLKENPYTRDIPVIFLSILESTEIKVEAFKAGGVDYITKPFHVGEVRARVRAHLKIRGLQLELEEQNTLLETANAELTRLAMIVDSSTDAIFTVSADSIITSWNGGAEDIFGYSAREIIGEPILTIMPAELPHERSHIWQMILSGEHLQYFETTRIRKDRKKIYVSITTSPLLNSDGEIIGNSVISRDVTERRNMEETIKHQARYDALTNLPNRQFLLELLTMGLAHARRGQKKLAVLFLDLNGFKQVNDTLGHNCGDRLLQDVALRLKSAVRETDTVARLGGDEFTVLIPDLNRAEDVGIILGKILGVFDTPFMLNSTAVTSATSIGISIFPDDGEFCDELIKNADLAMYEAKKTGRNSYRFFNAGFSAIDVGEHMAGADKGE